MRDGILLSIGLLGLAVFVGFALVVAGQESVAFDEAGMRWLVGLGGAPVQWFLRALTYLGSVPLLLAVVLWVAVWCVQRGARREAGFFVAVCTLAEVANVLLKAWFDRQRPLEYALVLPPDSQSFPSGHALMGTVVYGLTAVLLLRLAPEEGRRWMPAIAVLVLLVGVSRIVLGVHWPSDVLAGFGLGVAFVAAASLVLRRWRHPPRRPAGRP